MPEALVWYWQIHFPEPRTVGSILQIAGDQATYLSNAPRSYVWQYSLDGRSWREIVETNVSHESRMFRVHRLKEPRTVSFPRLCIRKIEGKYPTLREVEFYPAVDSKIDFPEWCVSVNTSSDQLPGEGQKFAKSLKLIEGGDQIAAQEIRLSEFQETLLKVEPRPLCAFMSGNLTDWCQKDREDWRGTQEILQNGRIPIWAACGGAQGLAILSEHGLDTPWDCPHCRDPKRPLTPIYTHIHDVEWRPCGDYSKCVHESGPTNVRQTTDDPVFEGLSREFPIIESHCGQVAWVPKGWVLIATHGEGCEDWDAMYATQKPLRLRCSISFRTRRNSAKLSNHPDQFHQIGSSNRRLSSRPRSSDRAKTAHRQPLSPHHLSLGLLSYFALFASFCSKLPLFIRLFSRQLPINIIRWHNPSLTYLAVMNQLASLHFQPQSGPIVVQILRPTNSLQTLRL